jgi:2-polyprenyl-3-methyl-5-hydroxy-6-metoxy-1,4-benzoquinol methylase
MLKTRLFIMDNFKNSLIASINMKKLNLGAGADYREGWVNHDISNKDIYGTKINVDVIWDLNNYPWPFSDNEFDEINASAILEHLESRTKPWDELKRIAKNGCIIHVRVPHYSGYTGYDDPTHYHRYSQLTAEMIAKMWGFRLIKNRIVFSVHNPILKLFNPTVNIFPRFYERVFANIFPSQELNWEFEKGRGERMDKSVLKKRLKVFYEQLSLMRKKSRRPSKSMDLIIADSNNKMKRMIKSINLKDISLADIGGADGAFVFGLSSSLSKDTEVTLIDISPVYLQMAKKLYKRFKGKLKFKTVLSDVDDLKIKEKFDVIFFRSILEHLYFPETSLMNLNNALKPGGLLLIITPNRNRLNELIKMLIPEALKFKLKLRFGTDVPDVILLEKKMNLKEHIHEYSFKELRQILKRNNFEIIKADYSTIPFIIPSLCDKYPILFSMQKSIIAAMNFIGLKKFLCFDFIILARKK